MRARQTPRGAPRSSSESSALVELQKPPRRAAGSRRDEQLPAEGVLPEESVESLIRPQLGGERRRASDEKVRGDGEQARVKGAVVDWAGADAAAAIEPLPVRGLGPGFDV